MLTRVDFNFQSTCRTNNRRTSKATERQKKNCLSKGKQKTRQKEETEKYAGQNTLTSDRVGGLWKRPSSCGGRPLMDVDDDDA